MSLDLAFDSARLISLREEAWAVAAPAAVFRVEGPGALTCLQGLLTNDLEAPGDDSLVYGAILTPKGMIVADLWVVREAAGFLLIAEAEARGAVQSLLARSLPPRLAKVTDLSDTRAVLWCLGHSVRGRLGALGGVPLPEPGKVIRSGDVVIGAGGIAAPFAFLAVGASTAIGELALRLHAAGVRPGGAAELAAARILAGWPTLGREIDERTLPQEVRFEEIGGVSFTKGCYTGQETVARVHFRGHVNRTLRGVVLEAGAATEDRSVTSEGKEVGRLRTALRLGTSVVALATVRRELADGASIRAGESAGRVIPLPVNLADLPA